VHVDLIVIEVGSTLTKVRGFDRLGTPEARFAGAGMAPTTVDSGDCMPGVALAIDHLTERFGEPVEWGRAMATSSAAGGLRMTVHGLVEAMTARAAREAALGAGAIVEMVTAGRLRKADLERIRRIEPNIVLLAGGVDHGERDVVVENARALAGLGVSAPVVYCGNAAAAAEVEAVFAEAGRTLEIVDNVYPQVDQLVVEPVRRVIQRVFEEHIVEAPGMENVRTVVDGPILPTPGAVLEAARLIRDALGDVMVVDVGGATTDVHSVTEGTPERQAKATEPEPFAKRTVEGDLGVWRNSGALMEVRDLDQEDVREVVPMPDSMQDKRASAILARRAAIVAVDRHAGTIMTFYGPRGREDRPAGRDLSAVRLVVGTGGALTQLPGGRSTLTDTLARGPLHPPHGSAVLLDSNYLLSSIGTMAEELPEDAAQLALTYFKQPR
jgi:uncharacterized protein (TIGR01319 family)